MDSKIVWIGTVSMPMCSRLLMISMFVAVAIFASRIASAADPCEKRQHEGTIYIICSVDPAGHDLRLFWKNRAEQPYRRFSDIAEDVDKDGRTLRFALNAGMYKPDYSPLGLYVQDGLILNPVNTAQVEGPPGQVPNFYKTPNGVFYLDGTAAGILPTETYIARRKTVNFATQSGPMLVIRNKLHPALIPGSSDRTRRSGVGVCDKGVVRFAISETKVNFHEFATLFRDALGCANALFLDGGNGSGIYSPHMGRNDNSWHGGFGPIFGLVD
jgi:uncharacterized protein YigE (DUF2233 family)